MKARPSTADSTKVVKQPIIEPFGPTYGALALRVAYESKFRPWG